MLFKNIEVGGAFKDDLVTFIKVKEVSVLHDGEVVAKKNALIVRGATTAGCGPEIYRPGDLIYFNGDADVRPLTLSF